jgi:ArsR family metal-binding transcriptional regulator
LRLRISLLKKITVVRNRVSHEPPIKRHLKSRNLGEKDRGLNRRPGRSLYVLLGDHALVRVKMLLNSYKITRVLPCLTDPEKIRVIVEISDEIHEVFPYLNATLKGCIYNHPALTLTIKKDGKLFTLYAHHITLAKIEDEKEAKEILGWLKDLINETYGYRDRIEPNFSKGAELKALDIYKLLPGTNCKKCSELTCLAFAVKLVGQEISIEKCIPLFSDELKGKRKVLLELLQAGGYEVPRIYLESKEV